LSKTTKYKNVTKREHRKKYVAKKMKVDTIFKEVNKKGSWLKPAERKIFSFDP